MKQPKLISCPRCGHVIGGYNKSLEERRGKEGFKSYCENCQYAVIPLYL